MARSVLLIKNDIFADGVSFKRSCSVMGSLISENYGVDIPRSKLLDMTAVSWGYVSYHEMRQAAAYASESLKPHQDPYEESIKGFETFLDKDAAWVKSIAPKKLRDKRTPRWIKTAIHVTDGMSFLFSKPNVKKANITLIVGQDSGLVLKTIANFYRHPKYFSLNEGATFDMVYHDVEQQITEHQRAYDNAVAEGKVSGTPGMNVGRADSVYHCIAGLAEKPLTPDVIGQLVRISELDPQMQLAININRADLLKFSQADLNAPHFHYLTIVDLDLIDDVIPRSGSNTSGAFVQSTYGVWVNPRTCHETLYPHIEYRPQQNAV
ncbi:hypothetical protein [Pantoea sp. ICBG 985]|uniref:hypothetical protein n=1 Tax=Pantoea sp. ICBG 985 TaxID=2071683 RepID=UPI000CE3E913|nr:hypothetical protein [Pantoea sp. ICBG 985]